MIFANQVLNAVRNINLSDPFTQLAE